jgi:hypothetical protein
MVLWYKKIYTGLRLTVDSLKEQIPALYREYLLNVAVAIEAKEFSRALSITNDFLNRVDKSTAGTEKTIEFLGTHGAALADIQQLNDEEQKQIVAYAQSIIANGQFVRTKKDLAQLYDSSSKGKAFKNFIDEFFSVRNMITSGSIKKVITINLQTVYDLQTSLSNIIASENAIRDKAKTNFSAALSTIMQPIETIQLHPSKQYRFSMIDIPQNKQRIWAGVMEEHATLKYDAKRKIITFEHPMTQDEYDDLLSFFGGIKDPALTLQIAATTKEIQSVFDQSNGIIKQETIETNPLLTVGILAQQHEAILRLISAVCLPLVNHEVTAHNWNMSIQPIIEALTTPALLNSLSDQTRKKAEALKANPYVETLEQIKQANQGIISILTDAIKVRFDDFINSITDESARGAITHKRPEIDKQRDTILAQIIAELEARFVLGKKIRNNSALTNMQQEAIAGSAGASQQQRPAIQKTENEQDISPDAALRISRRGSKGTSSGQSFGENKKESPLRNFTITAGVSIVAGAIPTIFGLGAILAVPIGLAAGAVTLAAILKPTTKKIRQWIALAGALIATGAAVFLVPLRPITPEDVWSETVKIYQTLKDVDVAKEKEKNAAAFNEFINLNTDILKANRWKRWGLNPFTTLEDLFEYIPASEPIPRAVFSGTPKKADLQFMDFAQKDSGQIEVPAQGGDQ